MSAFDVIDEFGLTYGHGRLLVALAKAGRLDKKGISKLRASAGVSEDTVSTHISKIRKMLSGRGIRIKTVHNIGYEMDEDSRSIVLEILNRKSVRIDSE